MLLMSIQAYYMLNYRSCCLINIIIPYRLNHIFLTLLVRNKVNIAISEAFIVKPSFYLIKSRIVVLISILLKIPDRLNHI